MKALFQWVFPLILSSLPSSQATDPYFNQQWSLSNDGSQIVSIEVDRIHSIQQSGTVGADIGYANAQSKLLNRSLAPVVVAVIDSGIDLKHPELLGKVSADGWNFLEDNADVTDDFGHGTHVAGIIAANSNNGIGISGAAAASVRVLPLRVLSKNFNQFTYRGKMLSEYVAKAVDYAVAHGAKVINLSLGWPKLVDSGLARRAIQNAVQKGILVVAAAGNNHKPQPTYPCSYPGVICVGSMTNTGKPSLFSDYGGRVDLLAPGDDILSLFPTSLDSIHLRIRGYEKMSGTSQAAPHVAAIAATIASISPELSSDEIKARLFSSSKPLPGIALYGLVNFANALDSVQSPVFVPDFKNLNDGVITDQNLTLKNKLKVKILGQTSAWSSFKVMMNDQVMVASTIKDLSPGQEIELPWSYHFLNLDESSQLKIKVEINTSENLIHRFETSIAVSRDVTQIKDLDRVSVSPTDEKEIFDWVGVSNLSPYLKLNAVSTYGSTLGLPSYYQVIEKSDQILKVQLVDFTSKNGIVHTAQIPGLQSITQVIKLDLDLDGKNEWAILGVGKNGESNYFQFYFLDQNFNPITTVPPAWQIELTQTNTTMIVRSYSSPGSWIQNHGILIPAFIEKGRLPPEDNYDLLNPRYYKSTNKHLFYLLPATTRNQVAQLKLRAIDHAGFLKEHPDFQVQAYAPLSEQDLKSGAIKVFASLGNDLDASIQLWTVWTPDKHELSPTVDWNLLRLSGRMLSVLDPIQSTAAYLSFYDSTSGGIALSKGNADFDSQSEFHFNQVLNPLTNFTGSYHLHGKLYYFLESNFNLIAFDGETQKSIPIERDSSFSGQQLSEMFAPMWVESSSGLKPAVYIDSTLVRGNQISAAVYDPESKSIERPLRYAFQVPSNCLQLSPLQLTRESGHLIPLLCQFGTRFDLILLK